MVMTRFRCQAWLHVGRPDRGQETRCPFTATYRVIGRTDTDLLVCGNHARAYPMKALTRIFVAGVE